MRNHSWQKPLQYGAKIAFVLWVALYLYGTPLPEKDAIVPTILHGEPVQEELHDDKAFQKKIDDYFYTFTPHATYTLRGLVVSLHHSDSWIDISHKNDPAQTVDICVVWGPNIATNGYKEVQYDHGDWTCYYSWHTEYDPAFSGNFLSNNHLIPHTSEEARRIASIKVGDQIELSGILTDYAVADARGRMLGNRHTSLVRTDTGNGACEILYLSSVQILKRNMPWRTPLMYALVLYIFFWFVFEIYSGIPRYAQRPETLTGKPHAENPYTVKRFLSKKASNEKAIEVVAPLEKGATEEGHDTPKEE